MTPLQAVLRYRDLLLAIARTRVARGSTCPPALQRLATTAIMRTMQKPLDDLLREAGATPEWNALLRDLDRLQNVCLEHRGADRLVRTDAAPNVAALFRHAYIALAPRAKQTKAASTTSAHKRRGRPKVVPRRLVRRNSHEIKDLEKSGVQVEP